MNKHILRIFTSHDVGLLVPAFVVYVRPFLEYKTVIWLPSVQPETLTQLNECSEGLLSVYVVTVVIPIEKNCIVYGYKVTQTFNY